MTIKSGMFNSVNRDRVYKAEDFASYFASFISNGVFPNPSNGLQVLASGSGMNLTLKPGRGWISGYYLVNDADHTLTLSVADPVLKRIDRVVMQLNYLTRSITINIKKGTPSATPVAPDLTRNVDIYELALADVTVNNGVITITQGNIADTRLNTSLCGIVHGVVNQVDTTTIFNQYMAWFEETKYNATGEMLVWQNEQKQQFIDWFDTIKDILDGDVAGNLASRIAVLEQQMVQMENHVADYVKHPGYGVTTFSSPTYSVTLSPAPTQYVDGMGLILRLNADQVAGNAAINVNGLGAKNILNSKGFSVTNLKKDGIYSFRYSTVKGAFILQGEGGEYGNAKEGDVVQGVTFGTEQGVKTGTLVAYKAGSLIPSGKVKERFSEKWVKTPINAQGKPFGIDRFGNIYIGYNYQSQVDGRLVKYNKSGQIVKSFTPSSQYGTIMGVDVGGDRVAAVCDDRNMYILDLDLNLIQTIPAGTYFSTHVAVDSLGNTYMQYSDTFEVRSVRKYNPSGLQVGVAQLTNNFNMMQLMATFDNQLVVLTPNSPVASLIKFTFSSYYATKSWETAIKTDVYGQLYQARTLDNGRIALATSGLWYNQRRDGPRIITYDANGAEISSVRLDQQYENYSYRWTSRFCLCPDAEGGIITSAGAISYINLSDDTKISFATEIVRRLRVNTYTLEHVGVATSGESNIFGVSWMNYSLVDDLIYYHDTSGRVRCYKKEYVLA